jgi:hypothetical protein
VPKIGLGSFGLLQDGVAAVLLHDLGVVIEGRMVNSLPPKRPIIRYGEGVTEEDPVKYSPDTFD